MRRMNYGQRPSKTAECQDTIRQQNPEKAERLLRQMARDFEKLYAEKGIYLDFNAYAEKWQRLLARHYKNVQDEFIGVASEELDVPMSRDKMALFILALQIMREQRTSASSRQIIDTSTEQMADSISKAELYMQQESMPISNDAVAALALEIFGRKIESRATTIAMTETQYVAETVKNIEADCLTNNKNIFLVQAVEQDASLAVSSYMTDAPIGYEKNGCLLYCLQQDHPMLQPMVKRLHQANCSMLVGNISNIQVIQAWEQLQVMW